MTGFRVYLSGGPLTGPYEARNAWRDEATRLLEEAGIETLNPLLWQRVNGEQLPEDEHLALSLEWLCRATVVLAYLDPPTRQCVAECDLARRLEIPVVPAASMDALRDQCRWLAARWEESRHGQFVLSLA